MNILFIAYSFNPCKGGVQRVTDILAKEFSRRGHKIYYLCGCNTRDNYDYPVPVYYMKEKLNEKFTIDSQNEYKFLLSKLNINIIINQYPILEKGDFFLKNTPPHIYRICFYHGAPLGGINRRNNSDINFWGFHKLFRLMLLSKYKYALKKRFKSLLINSEKLCFLSDSYANDVLSFCKNINMEKVCVIGNPNTFLTPEYISIQKQKTVLFVGRISDPVKNITDFIKVWDIISRKHTQWNALLIGDDSNCDSYKVLIKEKCIQNIFFQGLTDNISEYYKNASIICITSLHEGWPMVVVEAQQYGCVPISYDTYGAVHDLIIHNYNGYICPPYDIQNMVECLDDLMTNKHKLLEMSANAFTYIQRYEVNKVCDKWEVLFNESLNRKR